MFSFHLSPVYISCGCFLWAWLPRVYSLCHSGNIDSVWLYLLHTTLGSMEVRREAKCSCSQACSSLQGLVLCPVGLSLLTTGSTCFLTEKITLKSLYILPLVVANLKAWWSLNFRNFLLKYPSFVITLALTLASLGFLYFFLCNKNFLTMSGNQLTIYFQINAQTPGLGIRTFLEGSRKFQLSSPSLSYHIAPSMLSSKITLLVNF